ncbi:MAG: geranylgeranyl reductase family protein [Amylibacter sp.]|nr:geranylgeranyl reductase family protein [Amylibacter sp.]
MSNTNTSDNTPHYDVVIIGAGPAGSTTATYLARKNMKVLLLDSARFPRNKICGDGLPPRGVAAVDRLGVLDQVSAAGQHIDYFKLIAPSGKTMVSSIKEAAIEKKNAHMLAIPRMVLDDILVKHAVATGAELIEGCKVVGIEDNPDGVVVKGIAGREPQEFHAKYAVIATGASMGLLKNLGFLDKNDMPKPIIAARAYFENADHDSSVFNFHFNEVTLPGYGWVFPLKDNKVNVGVGIMPGKSIQKHNIKSLFYDFAKRPYMKQVLSGATQLAEVQSYPIRTDFLTATVYRHRSLLVGEAAGLGNALTGEGIDYAIESGEIAAEHLSEILANGDNPDKLANYALALDQKYAAIFNFSNRMAARGLNSVMLNCTIWVAAKRDSLRMSLTNIVLGLQEPPANISTGKVLMKVFKHLRRK